MIACCFLTVELLKLEDTEMKTLIFSILLCSLLGITGCAPVIDEVKHQIDRNISVPKLHVESKVQIAVAGPGILARSLEIQSLPQGAIVSAFRSPTVDTVTNGTALLMVPMDRIYQIVEIRSGGIRSTYVVPTKTVYTRYYFNNGKLFPKE